VQGSGKEGREALPKEESRLTISRGDEEREREKIKGGKKRVEGKKKKETQASATWEEKRRVPLSTRKGEGSPAIMGGKKKEGKKRCVRRKKSIYSKDPSTKKKTARRAKGGGLSYPEKTALAKGKRIAPTISKKNGQKGGKKKTADKDRKSPEKKRKLGSRKGTGRKGPLAEKTAGERHGAEKPA